MHITVETGNALASKTFESAPSSLAELQDTIRTAFAWPELDLILKWVDDDGDHVTISSDAELVEAVSSTMPDGSLKLKVSAVGVDLEARVERSDSLSGEWVMVAKEDAEDDQDVAQAEAAAAAATDTTEKSTEEIAQSTSGAAKSEADAEKSTTEADKSIAYGEKPDVAVAPAVAAAGHEDMRGDPKIEHRQSPAVQTQLADPETWTKILQLTEMGFGENYDQLLKSLQENNMDVATTADALVQVEIV